MSELNDPRGILPARAIVRGDTFQAWSATINIDDMPADIANVIVQLKDQSYATIHEWTYPENITIDSGEVTLVALPRTTDWPVGNLSLDVPIITGSGERFTFLRGEVQVFRNISDVI